jgi:hypothetical protein
MKPQKATDSLSRRKPARALSGKPQAGAKMRAANNRCPPDPATPDPETEDTEEAPHASPHGSGWPLHQSERRDFYHRIRVFPPAVVAWRKRLVRLIAENPGRFPLAAASSPEQIQSRLDEGITYLRQLDHILAA